MRRRWAVAFVLFAAACSSASPTRAPAPEVGPAPAEYGSFQKVATLEPVPGLVIHRYRSKKSGLELLISPKPGTEVVAYVTAYKVGSRFEVNGRTGLAHLFEHMMFRGTEHYPNPFETLSSWGDRFNAFTTRDVTEYHELVPEKLFGEAARFESERMRKLLITREGFDTERGAVVSERKMRTEDSPMGRLYWELSQLAYDRHPYKTGPIGWQEDLDATSFEDALAFYKRFYAPNRAVISLVGDFSVAEALRQIESQYGAFDTQPFEEPRIPREPAREKMRRKVIPMKVETVFLADAVFGPTYDDPHAAADSLIANLLADDKLGYLAGELVEKGFARSVSGDASPDMDPGLADVFVIGNPRVSVAKLEGAYEDALERFPSWLTAERLESFKLYYLAAQWESLREPLHLAQETAHAAATTGDPAWGFQFLSSVQKVTLEDIRARWASYWRTAARTRVILEPASETAPLGGKK
jgi:zinc protease